MTDRHWMTDLTDHYMNNTDDIADGERLPKEPNGLERFADALQVATMDDTVDPAERKQPGNLLANVLDPATGTPVDPDNRPEEPRGGQECGRRISTRVQRPS